MKKLAFALVFTAGVAYADLPVIDDTSITARQDGGKTVVIGYTMYPATEGDAEPAIVTVDVQTNCIENAETKWVSIGGGHLTTLSGDVNKIVQHTADYKHRILWNPTAEGLPNLKIAADSVRVAVTAWATNNPPAYWIIDLTRPNDRLADRYYPDAGQIPFGVTNVLYKTSRLVFRRIPAKGVTWRMGGTETANNYRYHYVTFSYDYWMAIYELTDWQCNMLHTAWMPTGDDTLPRCLNFEQWRGNPYGASAYNWPSNGHDKVSGIMNPVRSKLGGIMIDFPTHSEWEFACRAGSSAKYCNGDTEADLAKVAWYSGNATGVQEVGTREPNAWGLYDMHGNAAEWTLDKCTILSADPVWDPTGPMQDDADTGNSGNYKNKCMAACGGGTRSSTSFSGDTAADRCASWTGTGLLAGEGQCAARPTILIP